MKKPSPLPPQKTNYTFTDLINPEELNSIFESFSKTTGFTVGLIDNITLQPISKIGWRDICVKFHRNNPEACKVCIQSNKTLFSDLKKTGDMNIVKCGHGLYDGATPIIIEGRHLANLATGQLLMEQPDMEKFRQQAKKYGFDEEEYIKALEKVPVIKKEKMSEVMKFLANLATYIAETGLNKLKSEIANEKLRAQNKEFTELNKKLKKSQSKAKKIYRQKSAFLANMSHEIRTPMNGILGFVNLLNRNKLTKEKREKYINIINSNGKHLMSIISDIIDISKIEAKRLTLKKKNYEINSILDELYTQFSLEIAKKENCNIKLIKTIPEEFPQNYMMTNDVRLKQIFTNLITNAIKFTKKGTIEFGYELQNNKTILFFVKDTGMGVPAESQKIIFNRFRQANDLEVSEYGGTGLGLSISEGLVRLLKGKIWLESEIDKGSSFYFTHPYEPTSKEIKTSSKNEIISTKYNWKGKTILIVDDVKLIFQYLKEILKETEVKYLYAKNGKEAIDFINKNSDIDIVLMDIQLPDIDGYEASRIIKGKRKDIPIIAQTAYVMSEDRNKAISAGCNDYITKPLEKDDILKLINKYINKNN